MMTRPFCAVRIVFFAVIASFIGVGIVTSQQAGGRWITAWGTSQNGLAKEPISNATVRMIARVTIPGDAVRIRIDNGFGTTPLSIGKAYVGQRTRGAVVAPGSNRPVTFKGAPDVSVPPGGSVTSDPVPMKVIARQDLAVSLFVREAGVRASQHGGAQVTSYMSANDAGDVTAEESAKPFTRTTTSMLWLKSIDVSSTTSTGAIVAFGDSITDGTCTTLDGHDRWEDFLAVRLAEQALTRGTPLAHKAIVNEGIGGNTITREGLQPAPDSPPGLERLERDVLSHHGVTHVVLFMGTNDFRRGASTQQVMAGMQEIAKKIKAKGMKSIGVTIIPRHNRPPQEDNTGWNPERTKMRNEVNQWLRSKSPFDALIDFDKVVQDPADPNLIFAPFNCDDGIHPTPLGYYNMAKSIPLKLFE
jgi:lysophospholipase L1-like esterase